MLIPTPVAPAGTRIGLLGGSFDPPHQGHVHITKWAFRAIGLNRVWWLVSPGNPLKQNGPAAIDRRIDACRELVLDHRVRVTDLERRLGTRYSADTLAWLKRRHPNVRFVWLMGADNLSSFHHWQKWRWIMNHNDIAVFARPGQQVHAGLGPAARLFSERRLEEGSAKLLGTGDRQGRWIMLTGPMSNHSSTAIRKKGDWLRD